MPKWLVFCLTLQTALARFPHQRIRCHLPPQGGKLPPIFACSRSQEYSAVTQTTDLSCKYDKSGLIVWLIHCESDLQLSVLFKQGFKPELLLFSLFFLCFKGMHAFPFTSEINFPPRYTNLAVLSPFQWFFFFFFFAQGRKRTQEVLCCAVVGVETPHPSRRLNLMLGDETGNRCHPWPSVLKHYRPHNQGCSEKGGGGLLASLWATLQSFSLSLTNIR